jgi:hypothetical protein
LLNINKNAIIKICLLLVDFLGFLFLCFGESIVRLIFTKYGDEEITVEIETGRVNGVISNRALGLIQEWRQLRKDELIREWELVEQKKALFPIKPLE